MDRHNIDGYLKSLRPKNRVKRTQRRALISASLWKSSAFDENGLLISAWYGFIGNECVTLGYADKERAYREARKVRLKRKVASYTDRTLTIQSLKRCTKQLGGL